MEMTIKIKLSSGKEIELTKAEYDELMGAKLFDGLPIDYIPRVGDYPPWWSGPYIVSYPDAYPPTVTYKSASFRY